uniref:PLAT domain-containing protein n=1 Tax=Macrostomum lignano TaxID=282301 RepID=A0A1I8FKW2_9PLAT
KSVRVPALTALQPASRFATFEEALTEQRNAADTECRNTRGLLPAGSLGSQIPTANRRPGRPRLHCGRAEPELLPGRQSSTPRTSGDLTVLLNNARSNRVYVLALHWLQDPSTASAHPDAASRPSWRVVDVTEVSRIAEFDFLMDESHGLTKDTESVLCSPPAAAAPRSAERLGSPSSPPGNKAGANKISSSSRERRSRGGGGLPSLAVGVTLTVADLGGNRSMKFVPQTHIHTSHRLQNFDAVPNSAYGASRACGG